METKLLLVEDDPGIVRSLTEFLRKEGFCVSSAPGQQKALELAETQSFDLALLDVSLGEGNGYALCAAIKAEQDLPVIFLTASGDEYSVITGLNMGADDYVSKPFRPRELAARMRMVMRRCGRIQPVLEAGGLSVDTAKGTVTRRGQEIYLSALEYRLLLVFLNHRGQLLTRSALLEEIWDAAGEYVNDNTLTVYIKRLREKIEEDPQNPQLIHTVRGSGYVLREEA